MSDWRELESALADRLDVGCDELGLQLQQGQRQALLTLLQQLLQWNKAFNLTAIRDPLSALQHHLLDSLSIARHLKGERFIDVGTGPGFPGLPLAIVRPDWRLTLLDSNGKKIRFIRQMIHQLHLHNVTAVHARVEQHHPDALFDGVISRAFASLQDMIGWTRHLLKEDGRWYAMKGQQPSDELQALPPQVKLQSCTALQVPGLEAERHLVTLSPQPVPGLNSER